MEKEKILELFTELEDDYANQVNRIYDKIEELEKQLEFLQTHRHSLRAKRRAVEVGFGIGDTVENKETGEVVQVTSLNNSFHFVGKAYYKNGNLGKKDVVLIHCDEWKKIEK